MAICLRVVRTRCTGKGHGYEWELVRESRFPIVSQQLRQVKTDSADLLPFGGEEKETESAGGRRRRKIIKGVERKRNGKAVSHQNI